MLGTWRCGRQGRIFNTQRSRPASQLSSVNRGLAREKFRGYDVAEPLSPARTTAFRKRTADFAPPDARYRRREHGVPAQDSFSDLAARRRASSWRPASRDGDGGAGSRFPERRKHQSRLNDNPIDRTDAKLQRGATDGVRSLKSDKLWAHSNPRRDTGFRSNDLGFSKQAPDMKSAEPQPAGREWWKTTERRGTEADEKDRANVGAEERRFGQAKNTSLTAGGTLPLTTAASTWIYGKSAAMTCVRSGHRKIYNAYINEQLYADEEKNSLRWFLREQKISVHLMDQPGKRMAMDIACGRRPHQGVLLEVSPLPFPPVRYLCKPLSTTSTAPLRFELEEQRKEEREINKRLSVIPNPAFDRWRNPIVLLLDGVKDEGNLGNIIRTAYFYNVDAVAICVNTCAPVSSPIVAKAASGALEAMPLLRINKPTDFLRHSQSQTWKVWASVPPGKDDNRGSERLAPGGQTANRGVNLKSYLGRSMICGTSQMSSPLIDAPAILMLGSEGEGLRDIMLARADGRVSIDPPSGIESRRDLGIDSMNVASAAAVLLEVFMRKPRQEQPAML